MGKTWVLDTDTKGTGAEMVPLEQTLRRRTGRGALEPQFTPPSRRERPAQPPAPRAPARFKVTDVRSRATLVEDADARATIGVLKDARSIVDVVVSQRDPRTGGWRRLTLAQQRELWALRDR